MADKVGEIYYDVTLDTGKLLVEVRVVTDQLNKVGNEADKLPSKFSAVAAAAKVLAAAFAAVKAAQLADEIRLMASRVEVAAGSLESGAAAMAQLIAISRNTQTAVAANVEVFTRLNQSLIQMGGTQADTLRVTELLGKAIKVSGASAVEAKSAMLQFGQALGSGKLQGDELRSLMENAPYLMRQLADGIGVPVGALKKLGEEGKLTSDVVVNALGKAASQIESDFSRFPQTVGGAFQVAMDAAERANEKLDQLTGTSQLLTGAGQGLGQVLDKLADQFGAVNTEAGTLGRNAAVKSWADQTRTALSYVIDAADMVWQTLSVLGRNVAFVFTGIGAEIGGIGAQIAAVMRGDFAGAKAIGEAMAADTQARRAKLDAEDAKTLAKRKLFGEQMRDAWVQGAGGGRGSVNPASAASTLKAPAGVDAKKAKSGKAFDAEGYIAGLSAATASEWDRVGVVEQQALRKNAERLAAGQITKKQSEEAVTLIAENARQDRQKIMDKEFDDAVKAGDKRFQVEKAAAEKISAQKRSATEILIAGDPAAQLQFELETKSAMLNEYAVLDQANAKLYADAKVALEEETARKIAAISDRRVAEDAAKNASTLTNYSGLFSNLADVTKSFAGEQSGAYKALFAVQKSFALASSIIAIQNGLAKAQELGFPASLGAMASVAASTAGVISTIQGTSFGGARQYGGPVSASSLYRVNETGQPEMFTGSNGNQYMLPTQGGKVTAADEIGGNSAIVRVQPIVNINVSNSHPTASASARGSVGADGAFNVEVIIAELVGRVADGVASGHGPVYQGIKGRFGLKDGMG